MLTRTAGRNLGIVLLTVSGLLILLASAVPLNASAESVSGTWVSRVSGEGYVQQDVIYRWHYDVELRLSQSGSYASGTIELTLLQVDLKVSTYPPWPYELPQTTTYSVDGTVYGSAFEMTVYTGDLPTFTLEASGGFMTGSGSYYSAGALITGVFDLEKSGGFGLSGLTGLSEVTPFVSVGVIVVAVVTLVVVSTPLRLPLSPGTTSVPPPPAYEPSSQGTLEVPASMPSADGAVSIGGVGLHLPPPPPGGKPLPPREHFSQTSQQPPMCPMHQGVALVAHYSRTDGSDPGSWFCPRCNGYPWGRS